MLYEADIHQASQSIW